MSAAIKSLITVEQYINSLRNDAKRFYARRFAAWMQAGQRGDEPQRSARLSAMGAQAVALRIRKLMKAEG